MCDIEVFSESSESEGNEKCNIYDVDGEMLIIESENQAPSTSGLDTFVYTHFAGAKFVTQATFNFLH